MPDVHITVSGPGGTIGYELEIIRRAFVSIGCSVTVVDRYPESDVDATVKYREDCILRGVLQPSTIRLVADHQPWGG